MSEVIRPVTKAFYIHEEYGLPRAEEALAEFQETGNPVVLWWDEWSEVSADSRSINLTSYERDIAMMQVLRLCGIEEDFHSQIRLLKIDSGLGDTEWVTEKTFGSHKPTFTQIFNWLGDKDRLWADDPNTFNVGIAMDSPHGIVVIKYRSEEPFEDGDDIEVSTQIALYPKEKIDSIYWYADKYNPQA